MGLDAYGQMKPDGPAEWRRTPTEALAQVQDPINRQTLVALVGRLGGC